MAAVPATIVAEFTEPGALSKARSAYPETVQVSRSRWAQAGTLGRAVIECHGAGLYADQYVVNGVNRPWGLAGFPTFIPDCGGTGTADSDGTGSTHGTAGWGSDGAVSAIDAAVTLAVSQPDCKTGKVFLIGESMGTLAAMVYTARNPTKVKAVAVQLPALNLQDLHDNRLMPNGVDPTGPHIEASYGGSSAYLAALPTNNPMYLAQHGMFPTSIPVLLCYSATDPIALTLYVNAFQAFVGSSVSTYAIAGASGHDSNPLDPNVILQFLAAND